MVRRAAVIWFLLAFLAVLNGAAREAFITPALGEPAGHVTGTLIFCLVIFLVALSSLGWIGPSSRRAALAIGLVWVLLAVLFEFLAGHYLFGNSWETLLADYDVRRGRVWVLVLITSLTAPVLAYRVRTSRQSMEGASPTA